MALPLLPGRYPAELESVTVAPDRRRGRYVLRLEAVTERAVRLTARQPLASLDATGPYELVDGQRQSFAVFARRLGIDASTRPAAEVVERVKALRGSRLLAKVREQGRTGRMDCRMMLPEVVEAEGELALVDLSDRAGFAHEAHERLLDGRRTEGNGIAAQCRACFELREFDGWVLLGHRSIREYCATAEVGMSKTAFYDRALVWDTYVVGGGAGPEQIAGVGFKRLVTLAPAVRDGFMDAAQALAVARSLGARDFHVAEGELRDRMAGADGADVSASADTQASENRGDGPGGLRDAADRCADAAEAALRAFTRRAGADELGLLMDALAEATATLRSAIGAHA